MTLNQLPEGETARIESLGLDGRLRRRLMDIGMIPGTRVECREREMCIRDSMWSSSTSG